MPAISLITHFYNHPAKVEEQIAYWETLPPPILAQVEFVVIDDCSQQSPVLSPTRLDLKFFRITTDIAWNQAGARNLGAFHASADWAIYFDIDQRFYSEPMERILAHTGNFDPIQMYYLRSDNAFDPNIDVKLDCHQNTYLVNIAAFKIRGMFDEDFAGHYGYEDLYMQQVWDRNGGKRSIIRSFNFFEDLGFRTVDLDRDLTRNKLLAEQKLKAGARNSPGILRFNWEQVTVGKI